MPKVESRRQVVMTMRDRRHSASAESRGGKGANLVAMQELGLRVPPYVTLTTTLARASMQSGGHLPRRLAWQLQRGIEFIEKEAGKKFGDPLNPLLLSVRSGAAVSMPGMMDTILNLGMNRAVRDGMAKSAGELFAHDCYRRFIHMYAGVVVSAFGQTIEPLEKVVPADPQEQLEAAIKAVLKSWDSPRAAQYREVQGIPQNLGTAVTIQKMVFGNLNERSATGVVFSCNPNTGAPGLFGEFLPMAQGEDVVAGLKTPQPISQLRAWDESLFAELESGVCRLARHHSAPADVEFTIEDGTLYFLQSRKAKLTPQAKATFAVHQQWAKIWTKEDAVASLNHEEAEALVAQAAQPKVDTTVDLFAEGIAASPGAAWGYVATTSKEAVARKALGHKVILVRRETSPDDLEGMLAATAIVTKMGGATSHAAVVARQLGIPAVVGVGDGIEPFDLFAAMPFSEGMSVCGTTGRVFWGQQPIVQPESRKEVNIFRKWLFGNTPEARMDFSTVQEVYNVYNIGSDVYLSEAMLHAAAGTKLAVEARRVRDAVMTRSAEMFCCYLAIAVTSELRYAWASSHSIPTDVRSILEQKFGLSGRLVRGSEQALPALEKEGKEAQIEFFRLAARAFREGTWHGRSIGGPRWADIADAGHLFLSGAWKHGFFVDRVFDLRHNGGPVFDKHPMVSRNNAGLSGLLDVKREESGVGRLKYLLTRGAPIRDQSVLSPEVLGIWNKGTHLNLWKEEEVTHEPNRRRHY